MSYVTLAEARQAGIPGPTGPGAISDDDVEDKIKLWSDFIDRACRQWFEPRTVSLDLDGNDSYVLFLPVPIIEITSLYMNAGWDTAIDPKHYRVFNNRNALRDDRRNPKIEIASDGIGIYDRPLWNVGMFSMGVANQRVVGSFGFVEEDGSTPRLIKRAVLKLAIRDLKGGGTAGTMWETIGQELPGGPLQSESTDGHSVSYMNKTGSTKAGLSGITGDTEVDAIIVLYKGPILITSTGGAGGPNREWR